MQASYHIANIRVQWEKSASWENFAGFVDSKEIVPLALFSRLYNTGGYIPSFLLLNPRFLSYISTTLVDIITLVLTTEPSFLELHINHTLWWLHLILTTKPSFIESKHAPHRCET